MVINAYYHFRLKLNAVKKHCFSFERLSKVGNDDLLNLVFEYFEAIEVFKLGPIDNANGYMAYHIKGVGPLLEYGPIVFQTSIQLKGFGLVRSLKKDNAILFKMSGNGMFEVFVFNDRYASSMLLLQMLKDGALNYQIEEIKTRVIN